MCVEDYSIRANEEATPRRDATKTVVEADIWPIARSDSRDVANQIVNLQVATTTVSGKHGWVGRETHRDSI